LEDVHYSSEESAPNSYPREPLLSHVALIQIGEHLTNKAGSKEGAEDGHQDLLNNWLYHSSLLDV
jgi:hypothetical protein